MHEEGSIVEGLLYSLMRSAWVISTYVYIVWGPVHTYKHIPVILCSAMDPDEPALLQARVNLLASSKTDG